MTIGQPERVTQNRVVALFRDELGYRTLGDWTHRPGNDCIEDGLLTAWLEKRSHDAVQISRALHALRVEAGNQNRGLYENNRHAYGLLRYGVPVKVAAGKASETVKLIDWENPLANDFAIAEEVTLRGGQERRPDLVLYVNGIAIGVIELKNSRVSIADGIRQNLSNQRPEFNEWFFGTVQFVFAIGKLGWIKRQQESLRAQTRESRREYMDRESHYVWGKRYLLKLVEVDAAPALQLSHARLALQVRPGTDEAARASIIAAWYRQQVKVAAAPLIAAWQARLNITVSGLYVQRMKNRWGSANPAARTIRLNTELAKKPVECLDYIVLHEMAHLLEPTHGLRFVVHMDRCMPGWRETRKLLNALPVRFERWND